jgi:hypothetical protein
MTATKQTALILGNVEMLMVPCLQAAARENGIEELDDEIKNACSHSFNELHLALMEKFKKT